MLTVGAVFHVEALKEGGHHLVAGLDSYFPFALCVGTVSGRVVW